MHRISTMILMLLIASFCHGQSLADAARENRQQKATNGTSGKVITNDDFSAPPDATVELVPGATVTGQGTIVAPGRGKHSYFMTNLDTSKFPNGGVLHITISVGDGPSEASFDLYSRGSRVPSEGFPAPLASAHNVASGGTAKIDHRFSQGGIFRLAAEGSWNAKPGDTNTYSFVVTVGNPQN